MNKEEAQKEIEKAQKKFDKLQKKLDIARDQIAWAERMLAEAEPDTSELVFKPKMLEKMYYVDRDGYVKYTNHRDHLILDFTKLGNCFRTEEDAKNSAKYYIMNSEYDYWFPWTKQPKPAVVPKGLEFWNNGSWERQDSYFIFPQHVYRWKREDQ